MAVSDLTWTSRVAECVRQEPLIDTQLTRKSLSRADPTRAPRAVFAGIGLCSQTELSRAVPLDLLGMLLPAEQVRRAAGARELIVVIADRHARCNGFAAELVAQRTRATEAVLARVAADCDLRALSVIRASDLHREPGYAEALAAVVRGGGGRCHDYVRRQLADVIYLDRRCGPLLKVGWALRGADSQRRRDELWFDRALRAAGATRLGFVYCKPGRSLSDRAPRMPPYITTRPDARVCLDRAEDPIAKLATAEREASPQTVASCRRHLRAVLYTYDRMGDPLPRGPLEQRLAALVERLGGVPVPERRTA